MILNVIFQIWEDIISGKALTQPSSLGRFLLLTFAVSLLIFDVLHIKIYL